MEAFVTCSKTQEHIPLGRSMIAMAIKAICVAGMGRFFMDKKEVSKMATAYEDVSQSDFQKISVPPPRTEGFLV